MPSVYRILDANANRAREAMRVMEEASRFVMDDALLTRQIKTLRHDLAALIQRIPAGMLSANRHTPGDVGTQIKADGEMQRGSVAQVVLASGKRLSEALRAMEEYAKVLGESVPGLPGGLESLRYRGYTLQQQLERALASGNPHGRWKLCVLITQALCRDGDWLGVAQAAMDGGADCLQLREKHLDGGQLLERCRELARRCRAAGVSLIVNDRPDVALLAGADGVHVGQSDLPVAEIRRLVGGQLMVGVSTSNMGEVRQAYEQGADYVGLGPMFPTTTKAKQQIVGPAYLKEYVDRFGIHGRSALAIGGITPATLPQLVGVGMGQVGIAVSSCVCSSSDPKKSVTELRAMLQEAR